MAPRTQDPGRGGSRRRKWFLGGSVLAVLLAGAFYIFQRQVVDTQLRPLIERELTKAVHSPVSIESARGGLTGNVVLNNVVLTIPGNPWQTRLEVERVAVNFELLNLLLHRKPLENCFKSVFFIRPKIFLVHNESPADSGPASITASQILPAAPEQAGVSIAASSGVSQPLAAPLPLIPVPLIVIRHGSFFIQADKKPKEVLSDLGFEASTRDGAAWGLSLEGHSPEEKSGGIVRFNGGLRLETLEVSGKALLERWPLASAGSVLKDLAGWELVSGVISAESPIVFHPGRKFYFDATADLSQAAVRSPAPTLITLSQITGRAFIRPAEISVPGEITFQLGQTRWKASGLIPLDNRPLAVRTTTDQLFLSSVFTEILKIKDWKVDGEGSAILVAAGPFANPVIEGSAKLGPSHVGDYPLDSFSVKAGYEKGDFKLHEAAGKLYDGEFKANGFMSLSGEANAPVSLKAVLKNIQAKKLAATLGVSGMEGRGDVEVRVGGSLAKPSISATSQLTLNRTLRNVLVNYSVKANLQLKDEKLEIGAVINDKARLEGLLAGNKDAWELQKFSLTTGKKSGKLTGRGVWPKDGSRAIDVQLSGKDISLQEIPFFGDQFPDITGRVNLEARLAGLRKDPALTVRLSSTGVRLGGLEPEPMEVVLGWKPGELTFEKLEVGEIFSTSGKLGLASDSTMDLKIKAQGVPIQVIAEIGDWNNPPQPFEGWITGRLHMTGLRKNPIVEGNALVSSLKVGDWHADQMDALSKFEQGKLLIKKFKMTQGKSSFSATGSWDTRSQPGIMSLRFSADEFQLGKGPFLSGDFQWDAKTGEPFWRNWEGTFASTSFDLITLAGTPKETKKITHHFSDFSMTASSDDMVIKGKLKEGKAIRGSATIDLSLPAPEIQALLKISPSLVSDLPELTQFLPSDKKMAGKISGELRLKKGTFAELPLSGTFIVSDGAIQKYHFDRLELAADGNRSKVALKATLIREESKYSLAGTLESTKNFWDPESRIAVNGPFEKDKLQNILSLSGMNIEKHRVAGQVDGNLTISGTLANPTAGFSVTGENLRYDDNVVPSAELHFSLAGGRISLEKNRITLTKGVIDIEKGSAFLDAADPTVIVLDLTGSTKDVSIALFNMTSQIHMAGRLALEEKESRPTFDGTLSVIETGLDPDKPTTFDIAVAVHKKVVDFKPVDGDGPQLVGQLDLSQGPKIIFKNIHLERSEAVFVVDGFLDPSGKSRLTADAKNVAIGEVGKWLLPSFPLSGTGNYHFILDGSLEDPVITTSLSISNGRIGALSFDLLDGEVKAKENTLYLGTKLSPLVLSRKDAFTFNVTGKMPLALTKAGWLKVRNREMDIKAEMPQGDFSLILLAGLADEASGAMDFSARVTGTLDNPILTMDIDLKQCRLVPPLGLVAKTIEDISGRIKIRSNRLAVEDLNGRIGQGRVFITSAAVEESKMVLKDFIPQYLDFRVHTVGDHGVLLSIPAIMREGEWGEIHFYGASPEDPMLITGPLESPQVIGTALLDTGHYTFPPLPAVDKKGGKIEYRQLAGVDFKLKLKAGKNTWYSNEFNSQYLELKVNPENWITLTGKDSDRTPEQAGIKCQGEAGSKHGWLRYLGHEFKLQEANLFIPKDKSPFMSGRATDRLRDVEVVSAGGLYKTDVDIWVDFKGPFGKIEFNLDSAPHFGTDLESHRTILLSYIMFGRDMTPYTYSKEELQTIYQKRVGEAVGDAALNYLDRIVSYEASRHARQFFKQLGDLEFDVKTNISGSGKTSAPNPSLTPGAGVTQTLTDAKGNTLQAGNVSLAKFSFTKPLSEKLSVTTSFDLDRDLATNRPGVKPQIGLDYRFNKNLGAGVTTGQNERGEAETKVGIGFSESLPDIMEPKKGDKRPPDIRRFDIYPIGPGKFQVIWETDEVTRSEIKVSDAAGQLIQFIPEKKQHSYHHEQGIDKLALDTEYKIQLSVKDLNGNETVKSQKVSTSIN